MGRMEYVAVGRIARTPAEDDKVAHKADALRSPFPYVGGKSRVADLVWRKLGNVDNFIEPFMGSLAVLLRRPSHHFANGYRVETANDLNHFIVNFWRSVNRDPEAVAAHADWPVFEADMHARHKWLMRSEHASEWRTRMATDPEHYDAKIAGWWCWGACCWIGSGWCDGLGTDWVQPHRFDGVGVHGTPTPSNRSASKVGGCEKLQRPNLDPPDRGVNGRPQLTDAFDIGRGVNGGGAVLSTKMPRLTGMRKGDEYYPGIGVHNIDLVADGTCSARRAWLIEWMQRLADRLRLVRTCYGHWSRVCDSDSTLFRLGLTGVFLDPPYPSHREDTGKKSRDATLYATDKGADPNALRDEVRDWCIKWGGHKLMRVAVCGYEGDGYEKLVTDHGWSVESWEAGGGYANQKRGGKGKAENAKRERIWFSPNCVQEQPSLFDLLEDETAPARSDG
jgi:DNA adenine methylase